MTNTLSTELKSLGAKFSEHEHTGLLMTGEHVTIFVDAMKVLSRRALTMEFELAEFHEDETGIETREQKIIDLVVNELSKPESNLRAISHISRSPFRSNNEGKTK